MQDRIKHAISNGLVAPTAKNGIIKLTKTEIAVLEKKGWIGYTHKLKINADLRTYGSAVPNNPNDILFTNVKGH
jgi:hypothetical protein